MPKIVDHDQRRSELLDAVWRVIARDGIEGATMRSIAAETGWSSGALQHYFANKRDIVMSAHRHAYERVDARIQGRTAGLSGLAALRVALLEALPLDEERIVEARIEIGSWALAMNDPEFLAVRRESLERWRGSLSAMVGAARARGEITVGDPDDLVAHRLIALVDALSVEAVLFPHFATEERQLALADDLLESLQR